MIKELFFTTALLLSLAANAQTEIYNEDFQSGFPINYSIVNNDGMTPATAVSDFTDAWVLLSDPDNDSDTIVGSTSFFETPGRADRWLISSAISLSAFGNMLYWEARSHDPSFPDDYYVLVSRTDTQLSSFTDTVASVLNELEGWQARSANLSEYDLDNETIYVAFVNTTLDGFKLYIDDIRVEVEDPAGIHELVQTNVTTFPNPSIDYIEVSGNKTFNNYKIFSLSGEIIIDSTDSRIDVTRLEAGNYLMVAEGDDSIGRTSFIKL
ncbi:MAG: choice-of-anchor J domain-containing protein [Flavobacteriales bacterium]|nr:choice-of-anchor J domain-containing protein [Flavobacteriales bacterium]